MLQPIPSLPALIGRLDFRYQFQNRWQRNVFYFRGPATLPVGFVFRDWWNEAVIWLITAQMTTLPRDFGEISYWAFFNNGHFTHSDGSPQFLPGYTPYNCIDPALCPCYTTRAGPGRHFTGRITAPAIDQNMLDFQGKFKAVYISLFELTALRLASPFFYLGQTWFPAHFSPALGTYSNLADVRFLRNPTYLRRRRLGRDRNAPLYDYPVVP